MSEDWIRADWPAPANIHCLVTTRRPGQSRGDYAEFNLAAHVGDSGGHVSANRTRLQTAVGSHLSLQWLHQVHGCTVLKTGPQTVHPAPSADAVYCRDSGIACCVMTADCLPVCFTDRQGSEIAIAHAGWRGLAGGVLEATLDSFSSQRSQILAWLGPAIGPCHFEVGDEVRDAFCNTMAGLDPAAAFRSAGGEKWFADLYMLARMRLQSAGVGSVSGGGFCTYCDDRRFFSYRRNPVTGRFATLIYMD